MKRRYCFEEIAGFNDRLLIAIGWPLASLLVSLLLFSEQVSAGNWRTMLVCIPMSFVYTGVFWYFMRLIYSSVRLRFPSTNEIGVRVAWALVGFHVIYFIVDYTLDSFFNCIGVGHGHPENIIIEYVSSLILSCLVITMYEAISFYTMLQRSEAEKAHLERQNVESQLEGLRNQVNPHFLFNSLNTLTFLIPEDSAKAVNFVQKLSRVYRYVLESRDAKVIALSEELEFLQSYIFLLKERFGDNLNVCINEVNTKSDAAIIPLSLQMLFENAIKHNVISAGKPLEIQVFTENGHLVVRNNLQRKNQVMHSTGVGLQNIIDRYRMFSNKAVKVETTDAFFSVSLPDRKSVV